MAEQSQTRPVFIPAPVSGLNLIQPPHEFNEQTGVGLLPTEARQLDNYHVFDWGIRERGVLTTRALPDSGKVNAMYSFTSATKRSFLISTSGPHVYRYDGSNTFSSSLMSDYFLNAFTFNKRIFMPRPASGEIASYNLDSDSFSATSFTVGGAYTPNYGFAYKNRAYFINDFTSEIHCYDVAAVTGAIVDDFDFGQVFQRGRYLVWGTSWAFNQGINNEELMVVCNDAGEVLIYSGDYPAASNWNLVCRVDIPAPLLGYISPSAASPYVLPSRVVKLGQDLLITTVRGVVSLAQIIAGRRDDASYYTVSRKLGPVISGAVPDHSRLLPFAYFGGYQDVYVLNYERGAWSKFPSVATGTYFDGSGTVDNVVNHIAVQTPPTASYFSNPTTSLVLFGLASGGFKELSENFTTAESGANLYKWKTPFFDFGTPKNKTTKLIRVLARATSGSVISNEVSVLTNFDDSVSTTEDARSTTASDGGYRLQELNAPGSGTHVSYAFQKTASTNHQNEIAGFLAVYETGGYI